MAAAMALREHPLANGSYEDDGFVLHEAINVGMKYHTPTTILAWTAVGFLFYLALDRVAPK